MSLKAGDSFPQDVTFSYVLPIFFFFFSFANPAIVLHFHLKPRHPATPPPNPPNITNYAILIQVLLIATSLGPRVPARSPPAVSPSTTTPPRSGPTRRSSSSLCPVRHRFSQKFCILHFLPPRFSPADRHISIGAFTPVCSANHVPEYIQKLPELRAKGVDVVAVLAYNDAYVMSAWGKANGVTGDDIVRFRSQLIQNPNLSLFVSKLTNTNPPPTALPLRPRGQILQEHRLGRRRGPHLPLRHRPRPRQGHLRCQGGRQERSGGYLGRPRLQAAVSLSSRVACPRVLFANIDMGLDRRI